MLGRPGGGRRKRRDLRQASMRAALRIVERAGMPGLTMRAIASRTGTSHVALYRHFASKEELVAAIAETGFGILRQQLVEVIAKPADPLDQFHRIGLSYIDFAMHYPAYFRIMYARELSQRRTHARMQAAAAVALTALPPLGHHDQARMPQHEWLPVDRAVVLAYPQAGLIEQPPDLGDRVDMLARGPGLERPTADEGVFGVEPTCAGVVAVVDQKVDVASPQPAPPLQRGQQGFSRDPGVEDEARPRLEDPRERGQEGLRTAVIQVAKAVAEAECTIELGVPGQLAHVGEHALDRQARRARVCVDFADELVGQIDCDHSVPARGQRERMPAVAAWHIDKPRRPRRSQRLL